MNPSKVHLDFQPARIEERVPRLRTLVVSSSSSSTFLNGPARSAASRPKLGHMPVILLMLSDQESHEERNNVA